MAPSMRERTSFTGFGNQAAGRNIAAEKPVVMHPAIWGQLPDHLLDRILALLPLPVLLSLRPTCPRFHSLLQSPSFLSQLHSRSPSVAYFLLSHPQFSHRFLILHDTTADSWRKLSIPTYTYSNQLLSCSSGLLCFSVSHPSSSLLVYNLLMFSSRIVRCPIQSPSSVTLISKPHRSPHGYKIFLSSSVSNSFFLYDSDSWSWTSFPLFAPLLSLTNSHQDPVFFNRFLYFTTPEPFSVVGFDLIAKRWETEVAPQLPPELAFIRLVSGGGGERLFLIAGIGRDGISRSLKVWELVDGEQRRWEEVGRLPDLMCRKFVSVCYHNYLHVSCIWHEGMVCVCCTTWSELLVFKVARGTWHWLPKCPMLQDKWSCGFRWFSFVPDIYAMV
ncbi:hypothetical protein HPP92_007545 [Vanilla planifolia]|uniref:F-box domain-containing protein n=1 Tax=Vanilla planifolia TaxID=51239 RepID=A0A835RH95_VANPL|nr:hypothetical protein HPP92_007765 [Vanilla planifolia]KAG0490682.1 hypothetical protein HPP92_007545 [Vanilla planifolia]